MAEQQPIDRQQNRMSLRETLGSRFQSLRGLRSRERKSSQDGPASKDRPASNAGPTVMSPRSREALAKAKQEALDNLPAEYYQPEYDSVAGELALLPRMFTEGDLEHVVEERSGVLETVSERLSQHVLSNYSKFVTGVTEVASVEQDLQEAHAITKASRGELANALAEVKANMVITTKQRQKQGLERMLEVLQQLREAANLHDALRSSQENGEFAGCFWLCAQCAKALEPLSALRVTPELTSTVGALYEETVARLESSLQTVCADFQPDPYAKVLEGYVYLGNVSSLGEEVMAAFAAVMGAAALKVVRGVVLMRPTAGLEERAKSTQLLQELVKWLPPDLFRTCLSRVLMVEFEILSSHLHMARWHEAKIEQHTQDLEALQEASAKLKERLAALDQEDAQSPSAQHLPLPHPAENGAASHSLAENDWEGTDEEEAEEADAGIAAVVERTLQQAVVSKSMAAGRSGTLGTSDSSGVHVAAESAVAGSSGARGSLEALSAPVASDTAEDSSPRHIPQHPSLTTEGDSKAGSSSGVGPKGTTIAGAQAYQSSPRKQASLDPSDSSAAADLRPGAKPDPLDTGQSGCNEIASSLTMREPGPASSPVQPKEDAGQVKSSSRPNSAQKKSSRRRSQADSRALEREYLEGELDALGEKEQEEALWGDALLRVEEGLNAGRRWLWDEASRKVGVLIAAPSAFQGEHFLQVLEWTQTIMAAGEAFCGSESATLRDALRRQSGRFFAAFHSANLQTLHSMLEREVWKQLPMIPDGLPSIRAALDDPSVLAAFPFDTSNFGDWVVHGNPWHMQAYEDEVEVRPRPGLAKASSQTALEQGSEAGADSESETAQQTEAGTAMAASHANGNSQSSGAEAVPPMTTSSLRLAKWLTEYAHLMRVIRSDAGRIWSGMAELFELYFLHTFHTFGDIPITALMSPQQQRQGGMDIVPTRLKNAVLRIVARSKHRSYYLPQREQQPSSSSHGTQSLSTPPKDSASPFNRPPSGPPSATPEATALSNPGNMYGLMERKVAVDSLRSVAALLTEAHQPLDEVVHGRLDVPEGASLETVFSAVKATADLRDMVLRAAARYNLPIRWLPERLAEQNFNIQEPPSKASPWVRVLMGHLQSLRQRLDSQAGLTPADISELWRHAMNFTAEVVLEGIAKAGARGKCTPMGRAAMSLDLQALQRGMAELAGPSGAEAAADALRIVDTYIKAYYLPWDDELRRWALTHPEYTRDQIMMLVVCIADANGLKRKERNAFLTQMEAELTDFRPMQ